MAEMNNPSAKKNSSASASSGSALEKEHNIIQAKTKLDTNQTATICSDSGVPFSDDEIIDRGVVGTGNLSVISEAHDLCNNMWLRVFSYLSIENIVQIETVCSRWTELARYSWNYIPSLSLQSSHTRGLLQTFAERLPRLKSINLIDYDFAEDVELLQVFELQRLLQSFDVSFNSMITGQCFDQAPHSLTKVSANYCENLTDRSLSVLFERCPNLEKINVNSCAQLTGQFMTALVKNCQKLKSLGFANVIRGVTAQSSHFLELSNGLPLLEELKVDSHDTVDDDVFYHLGRSCPRLKTISCSFCEQLTDTAILNLSPCQQLEDINLSYTHITDKGLLQLGLAHTGLKRVLLARCLDISSDGVGDLCSACPDILELSVAGTHVTVSENIEEEEMWWTLKSLRSLQELDVNCTEIGGPECFTQAPQFLTVLNLFRCHLLTDRNICVLSERCPNLESIDIGLCTQLTGRSITALAKNCQKLKELLFDRCRQRGFVRPRHLMKLAKLPLLEELSLSKHTVGVTDLVLYHLGRSCPRLRVVDWQKCLRLTDESIVNLSPCQQLESIVLSDCKKITDKGLIQLGSAHTELRTVRLNGCKRITSKGVGDLCSASPDIQFLDISKCPHVSDDVLPVLQDALCSKHKQEEPIEIFLYGTSVTPETAMAMLEDGVRSELLFHDMD